MLVGGDSKGAFNFMRRIGATFSARFAADEMERTQKGATDVTEWLTWFLACLGRAIHGADGVLAAVIAKAQSWERAAALALNERQIKILNRLLDGFEGKMTSSKWATIAKCSQDTANRDIAALLDLGLLRNGEAGGCSTSYELVI
jgi:Fic family protein